MSYSARRWIAFAVVVAVSGQSAPDTRVDAPLRERFIGLSWGARAVIPALYPGGSWGPCDLWHPFEKLIRIRNLGDVPDGAFSPDGASPIHRRDRCYRHGDPLAPQAIVVQMPNAGCGLMSDRLQLYVEKCDVDDDSTYRVWNGIHPGLRDEWGTGLIPPTDDPLIGWIDAGDFHPCLVGWNDCRFLPCVSNFAVIELYNLRVDAIRIVTMMGAVPGDWDGDLDVDLSDWLKLSECFGSEGPVCIGVFDFDNDNDVDLADLVHFQSAAVSAGTFRPPERPPTEPPCATELDRPARR